MSEVLLLPNSMNIKSYLVQFSREAATPTVCIVMSYFSLLATEINFPERFEFPAHLIKILERHPHPSVRPTLHTWGWTPQDILAIWQ